MYNQRIQFVAAIVVGFVVAFCLLPVGHDLACVSSEQNTGAPKHTGTSEQNKNQAPGSVEAQSPNTDHQNDERNQIHNEHWPNSLICGEMKLTDLALAFFTYTLAVIGWFGLRSSEQTAEAVERAYVFLGYDPVSFNDHGRAKFTLVMTNTGRMPGGIKEVGYAFLKRSELPKTREEADWSWIIIPYDWMIPAIIQTQIGSRKEIAAIESPHGGDNIFVSYIKYQDMFSRRMHTSWIGMHLYPASAEQTARAGGDVWNDWD
jgi:hypothetical protein